MRTIECALAAGLFAFAMPAIAAGADEGAKVYEEVCTSCHTAKNRPLDGKHLTREQWNEAIQRMVGFGAEIPKGKMPALLDYLVRTRGPAGEGAGKK